MKIGIGDRARDVVSIRVTSIRARDVVRVTVTVRPQCLLQDGHWG